jgi:aminoglycoside 3-N-acetyltransferase I
MDSRFRIARLTPADLAAFRGLNAMFGQAFEDAEAYGANPPSDAYVADLLGKPQVAVLAAFLGDEVVAGLVAYELEKFEQARREFYIYDLAVLEEHRRLGLATALIDHLRGIARERGGWVIYVQADYGDDPAIALYEKLGVREDVMHFDIDPAG